jgi:inhibitor of cysteine peptidase
VYFGESFDDVNNAAGGIPQGTATYTPGPLKLSKTYYWRVDEFDALATYKGEVWSFTTEGAVGSPNPSNGAVDVKQTQVLTWSPGVYSASHQIYFGTDKDAVRNADTGSPEYKGSGNLGSESHDPGMLEWDSTYYWRIDEANNTNPDSPWTGNVWSFTTANFLVVDDFEDYDIGNNEIWWTWIDGLGYASHPTLPAHPGNGTGSMVGDETTGSYMEETIVHGGAKSMPVFYDNSILRYSEVEKTLTYPRDWTEKGVDTLTIWFRGISDNAAETLYVVLNGSAVVTYDNPNAALLEEWTEWNIDLQAFGVNLTNVNTIGLGLGDRNNPQAGGSGTMYFDDIRLYPPPPEPLPIEVHVDVDDAGSQVELEEGQILVVTLESNPTTGYRWEQAENQESILEQMGEAEFKPSETGEPPLVGAGGWEIFRFKAISAGQMTLQLVYHRSWEEGVEPLKTFSLQVVVR